MTEQDRINVLEGRLTRLEASLEKHLDLLTQDVKELKKTLDRLVEISQTQVKLEGDVKSIKEKTEDLSQKVNDLGKFYVTVTELKLKVEGLEEKEESMARKAWEIARLIISSVIGAAATLLTIKATS